MKCTHRSVRGPITCNWKREGDTVAMEVRVPVNTTVVLHLPQASAVTENGKGVEEAAGIVKLPAPDGYVKLHLQSGSYRFTVVM